MKAEKEQLQAQMALLRVEELDALVSDVKEGRATESGTVYRKHSAPPCGRAEYT